MSAKKASNVGLPPIPGASNTGTRLSVSAGDDAAGRDYENPFKLPSDDKIFRVRDEEKRKRQEERDAGSKIKLWDKTKGDVTSRTERLQKLVGDMKLSADDLGKLDETKGAIAMHHRQEKENMTEFIAKKREMFLVQMSLDTKREEIRKLEEKAQMKEEALQRSEQMLEEDTMRFDAFLKENDKKAHEAIKKAEEESKRKQEKTQEIKKYTQQIQALNSEMSKHKEALDDCLRYKQFLDMLTPPEHFEEHKRSQEDKKNKIRRERHEKKYKDWEQVRKRIQEQQRKEQEAKKDKARERGRRGIVQQSQDEEENEDVDSRLVIPVAPKLEDEVVELPEEEPPMYFTDPQQLMDIFAALEEQNLFLIQNSQETEHTLEELQHSFKKTKLDMETQTGQLQEQIAELTTQISSEKVRAQALQQKRMAAAEASSLQDTVSGPQSQQEKERLLAELNKKVRSVYESCGFNASSKPSTIYMLSQLENKLEMLLQEIEKMPTEYVIKAEKEKEKKRRERKREEQQALQIRQQEERNKRATERSMQAPKKRTGRQVMFRSRPIRKEQASTGDDDNDQNNTDEVKFLS
jgi:hypothetical protein